MRKFLKSGMQSSCNHLATCNKFAGGKNEVAVQTITANAFKNRLENEGLILEVNDKVTLNRRVGRNQVKGKIVKVHLSDHEKLY